MIIFSVHKEEYEGMLVSKSKLEIKEKNLPKRKKKSTRKSKEKKVKFSLKILGRLLRPMIGH